MPGWFGAIASRPRLNLLVTTLVGMTIGLGLVWHWSRASDGFTLDVLGSGNGASVLISHDHRHILIVAGNDGAEFSNALDTHLNRLSRDIDLVLISRSASQDVAERARNLGARATLQLPGSDEAMTNTISQSITVPLDNENALKIVVAQDGVNWYGWLASPAGPVLILGDSLFDSLLPVPALVVLTDAIGDTSNVSAGAEIGPPGEWADDGNNSIQVRAGESVHIDLGRPTLHVPVP